MNATWLWVKRNAHHVRGALAAATSAAAQVLATSSPDGVASWTPKRWAIGVVFVVLPYLCGWLTPSQPVQGVVAVPAVPVAPQVVQPPAPASAPQGAPAPATPDAVAQPAPAASAPPVQTP